MKKIHYVFAVFILVGALLARPAHAESYEQIQTILASLIAQVQELQRQLLILQKEEVIDSDILSAHKESLDVTYPKGGERFEAGTTVVITWNSKSSISNEPLELRLKSDSCVTTNHLIASDIKNNGSYAWKISEDLINDKCGYKIYLMVANVKSSLWDFDESNGSFQIGGQAINQKRIFSKWRRSYCRTKYDIQSTVDIKKY